jgi:hypothetical protein
LFVFSYSRTREGVRRLHHAEELVSRFPHSGTCLAEPGALPGFFRLLSVRNRWIYVMRLPGNWRTSCCVAPSSPCIPPNIHLQGVSSPAYSVRSAHTFASGFLKAALRTKPLPLATLRRYLPGAGLAQRFVPHSHLTSNGILVRCAKRHQQAAGPCPAHNQALERTSQ